MCDFVCQELVNLELRLAGEVGNLTVPDVAKHFQRVLEGHDYTHKSHLKEYSELVRCLSHQLVWADDGESIRVTAHGVVGVMNSFAKLPQNFTTNPVRKYLRLADAAALPTAAPEEEQLDEAEDEVEAEDEAIPACAASASADEPALGSAPLVEAPPSVAARQPLRWSFGVGVLSGGGAAAAPAAAGGRQFGGCSAGTPAAQAPAGGRIGGGGGAPLLDALATCAAGIHSSPPPALPPATSPVVQTVDPRARSPFLPLFGPLVPQFNGSQVPPRPVPPPSRGKPSKVDQAFETGRQEGLREAQAAQAKEQQHDRERLVATAEYDLAHDRLMFRIQGGAGVKVLVRLKRVATQSDGQTTFTTMSYTDMVEVVVKYPSACGVGCASGGDGGSGGGCIYDHDPAGSLPRAENVIRRTGWLTLGYELAATYDLGKHGSKVLREDELNEQSALYMRAAADCNFIELAVFLERSPESQSSHGSLGAIFSDEEVANEH